MQHGVPEDAITMISDETEAVDHALNMAEDGDLLVILGDNSARCWKQIVHFRDDVRTEEPAKPAGDGTGCLWPGRA